MYLPKAGYPLIADSAAGNSPALELAKQATFGGGVVGGVVLTFPTGRPVTHPGRPYLAAHPPRPRPETR